MNNYKIVGSFHISPSLKQINNNKYTLNLEKVFSHIQTYLKFNNLISLPVKNNIISYIVPDYNIKFYKSPSYLLSKIKNVKIIIYYTEKHSNNNTTISFSYSKESITLKKKKKLKFLSFDQYITLSSTQKISKIVISGILLDGYNNFSNFCFDEKKLLKDIFFWFSNSHVYSINKLVEILQSRSNLTQEEKINLIRSEMLGTTNDFINSGIINEVCNKLEKII